MRMRIFSMIVAMVLSMSVVACGKGSTVDQKNADLSSRHEPLEEQADFKEQDKVPKLNDSEKNTDTQVKDEDKNRDTQVQLKNDLTYADLAKCEFEFCSGAGAWSTNFTIEKDGYFKGNYHDANMGDFGKDYENGTIYSSVFKGHFTNLTQVDTYCYEMTLSDITYSEEIGTEEIIEGTKYIYTDAYGLSGTDTFKVYLPGTPISEISKEIYEPWFASVNKSDSVLTMIAIVSESEGQGIYSYEREKPLEEAQKTLELYKESYAYWSEKVSHSETQLEMNNNSAQMYKVIDDCLNELWDLVKYNTDDKAYQQILIKQREWISNKENQANEAAAEYEGESFAKTAYYDKLSELTMARCEELVVYLEEKQ